MNPSEIIDQLVLAYNRRDIDAFCSRFSVDATAYEYPGQVAQSGRDGIRQHYAQVFQRFPGLHTQVRHRIDLGLRIIDHEHVDRGDGSPPFDCVAIYQIEDGLIQRFDIVRQDLIRHG